MLRLSAVQTVTLLGFTIAVVLDDFHGGPAASAAKALAADARVSLAPLIDHPTTAAVKALAAEQAARLLAILSGERSALRKGELADERIEAGGGLKIVVPKRQRERPT